MTSIRWFALSLVVAACSTRSSSPPREIGAAPSATPDAPSTPWDPAALPRTVAVTSAEGSLTLARVTTTSVEVVGTIASPGPTRGWLDARTLVGLTEREGGGFVVVTVVDGQRGEELAVTPAEWPAFAAELVLGDGELWLSGCKAKIEFTDCAQPTAIRLVPGPRVVQDQAPTGRRRYGYHGAHRLPAPSGPAPAGVTARLDEVRQDAAFDPEKTFVICAAPDGERRTSLAELFDVPLELEVYSFAAPTLRWLATTPPLLEVSYAYTDPVEITRAARHVLRPCDRPFEDFRWIGDGVWAKGDGGGEDSDEADWSWTFHRGDRVLGTLRGGALD